MLIKIRKACVLFTVVLPPCLYHLIKQINIKTVAFFRYRFAKINPINEDYYSPVPEGPGTDQILFEGLLSWLFLATTYIIPTTTTAVAIPINTFEFVVSFEFLTAELA